MEVLKASLSYAGIFKPIEAFGSMWFSNYLGLIFVGGAAIYETDVISPIMHCESEGFKEENIIMDVILGGNPRLKSAMASIYNAPAIA